MEQQNNTNSNKGRYYVIIGVLCAAVVGLSIAYATLSATLNITFGNVTQNALSWNVGFDTTGSPISATVAGTSDTGRSCGTATVENLTVTISDTTLSKPEDGCTYALKIKNTGDIDARFSSLAATQPTGTGVSCTVNDAKNTIVCGNVTYKITTDAAGTTGLTSGSTLAKTDGELPVYVSVKYTGNTLNATPVVQSGAAFTLTYTQA